MTKLGIVLILICALSGAIFHVWTESETPASPAVTTEKAKPESQDKVNFGPYMDDLQRRIKRSWFPPKSNQSKHIQVVFKVKTDGTISGVRLQKSSKSGSANAAALKAVNNASPVRPLPAGAPSEVNVQFTFDYNVIRDTDTNTSSK
ncbi:MAG: TonB C-terminal domain-containing protein [Candidatus Obscuribacterales bacterium]|nr:TonB C-terminal domain-containing protein [Candidatus Obscuribacterales bacterium]